MGRTAEHLLPLFGNTLLYSTVKEGYRMLRIDSTPKVEIKQGANTTYDKPYFMELWRLMDEDREMNEKELEGIRKLKELL